MFDKLVVSSTERRKHRTARFFAVTVLIYVGGFAAALVLSVLFTSPNLADTNATKAVITPIPIIRAEGGGGPTRPSVATSRPDPRRVKDLDQLIRDQRETRQATLPPRFDNVDPGPNASGSGPYEPGPGIGGPGVPGGIPLAGAQTFEPPPRPELPQQPKQVEVKKPLPLASVVLQGKAIQKVTPPYNSMARQIKLQGEVSVEVIVSPEGRVESARVMKGHPLFAKDARDAAMGWRFQPTLLNGVPVRVTGVITFVFRLGD